MNIYAVQKCFTDNEKVFTSLQSVFMSSVMEQVSDPGQQLNPTHFLHMCECEREEKMSKWSRARNQFPLRYQYSFQY